jgi:lipopolysaccharide export system protein LptA
MSAGLASQWCRVAGAAAMAASFALGVADAAAQQQQQKNVQQQNAQPQNAQQQQKNQGPPNALQGFSQNRDEPVKIRAASLEVREKDKMATFTGDVHVLQGDTEMRCKTLVVFYEEETTPQPSQQASAARPVKAAEPGPGGDRQIRLIEAKGNVVVVQKDQNAAGDAATFNMRKNTVTLVGNVVVTRGADVLRGQRLVVDLTSGVSTMDQGRVEGLFQRAPPEKK